MSQSENQKSRVTLHIERLVLDGIPVAPGSTMQLQLAVQDELTRLLTDNGLQQVSYALPSAIAPAFPIGDKPGPAELGRNIADSIYKSLKQT